MPLMFGSLAAAASAGLAWRGYRNALGVRVQRHSLLPPELPAELDGLRIVLLSDLHLPGVARARERLLSVLAELEADVTLIAGDLVETQAGIDDALKLARDLARAAPTYAVFGSHDHFEPRLVLARPFWATNDAEHFRRELERLRVRVLANERTTARVGGGAFELIGVDDPYLHLDDLDSAIGSRKLEGFSVLLSHSPDVLPLAARRGVRLLLAGHTHGGQIAFPLIGAPITHSRVMRWRRPAGERRQGDTLLYTCRGFGTTTLPLRYNAPPEVTLLTLRADGGEALRA